VDIRDFVRSTLTDIVAGLQYAAVDLSELAAISPGAVNGKQQEIVEKVEFDIAVTVSSESESHREGGGKVGGKLRVVAFEAELYAKGKKEDKKTGKHDEISRIKFSIPIQFNAHFRNDPNREANNRETRAALSRLYQGLGQFGDDS
jgi:hypothetical protein